MNRLLKFVELAAPAGDGDGENVVLKISCDRDFSNQTVIVGHDHFELDARDDLRVISKVFEIALEFALGLRIR